MKAIRRELYEETGLRVEIGSLLGVLDRREKDAITPIQHPEQWDRMGQLYASLKTGPRHSLT